MRSRSHLLLITALLAVFSIVVRAQQVWDGTSNAGLGIVYVQDPLTGALTLDQNGYHGDWGVSAAGEANVTPTLVSLTNFPGAVGSVDLPVSSNSTEVNPGPNSYIVTAGWDTFFFLSSGASSDNLSDFTAAPLIITLGGGNYDGVELSFPLDGSALPDAPALSLSNLTALTMANGSQAIDLDLPEFNLPEGATWGGRSLFLSDTTVPGSPAELVNDYSIDADTDSYLLAADLFGSGRSYALGIVDTYTAADGITDYSAEIAVNFTTIPEPSAWAALGGILVLACAFDRKISAGRNKSALKSR